MKEGRNDACWFYSHMRDCLMFDFPGLEILFNCNDYNLQDINTIGSNFNNDF